jgi:hypothetical protein
MECPETSPSQRKMKRKEKKRERRTCTKQIRMPRVSHFSFPDKTPLYDLRL